MVVYYRFQILYVTSYINNSNDEMDQMVYLNVSLLFLDDHFIIFNSLHLLATFLTRMTILCRAFVFLLFSASNATRLSQVTRVTLDKQRECLTMFDTYTKRLDGASQFRSRGAEIP